MNITRHIPNAITCLNLLSGCVAIIFTFSAHSQFGPLMGWQWACVAMGAAAVFDFLDGAFARLLKAYSEIGAELDSLSDLVSFGVAPAMLIFNLMQEQHPGNIFNWFALLVPVFGALRLARFNVMDVGQTVFRGLPIPSAAIFLIGVAGWMHSYIVPAPWIMALICLAVGFAMVARFELFSLKFKNFTLADNFRRYMILIIAVAFLIMYGLAGLSWTIILYVLLSVMSRRKV